MSMLISCGRASTRCRRREGQPDRAESEMRGADVASADAVLANHTLNTFQRQNTRGRRRERDMRNGNRSRRDRASVGGAVRPPLSF